MSATCKTEENFNWFLICCVLFFLPCNRNVMRFSAFLSCCFLSRIVDDFQWPNKCTNVFHSTTQKQCARTMVETTEAILFDYCNCVWVWLCECELRITELIDWKLHEIDKHNYFLTFRSISIKLPPRLSAKCSGTREQLCELRRERALQIVKRAGNQKKNNMLEWNW